MKANSLKGLLFALVMVLMAFTALHQARASELDDLKKRAQTKFQNFEQQVKDMVVTQKLTAASPSGQVKSVNIQMKKGKKLRIENEMTMPGAPAGSTIKTIAVSDGVNAYIFSPFQGKQKLPPEQAEQISRSSFWWEKSLEKGKVAGKETIDGHDCLILEIEPSTIQPFSKIWLDKDRLIVLRAVNKTPQGQEMLSNFKDYRKVTDDFEVPYKTESLIGGAPISEGVVESVVVNKGLDDDLFDPEKITPPSGMTMEQLQNMMKAPKN